MAPAGNDWQRAYDAHGDKLRFLIVGVWNSVFAYGVFVVLLYALEPYLGSLASSESAALGWIGAHYYLLVQWAAWFIAVPQSTLAFGRFVFGASGRLSTQISRAYQVSLPIQLVSTVLLWLFSGVLGLSALLGQLLTAGVAAVLTYVGHKYYTFESGD